jgi:hypothetical protein
MLPAEETSSKKSAAPATDEFPTAAMPDMFSPARACPAANGPAGGLA